MEIKRKLEMSIATDRRYTVRRAPAGEQMNCAVCGAAMLTAEQAAAMFGVTQRIIFRHIENASAHYAETVSGAVMICLPSLASAIDRKGLA